MRVCAQIRSLGEGRGMRLGVLQPVTQFYAPGMLTKDGLKNFF